jgi:hypothetical protein
MQYYKRYREESLETLVPVITLIRSIAYRYEGENQARRHLEVHMFDRIEIDNDNPFNKGLEQHNIE